jgi:hypothetical protein
MGSSGLLRKPVRANYDLRIYDPRTRKEYRESANTSDEQVALDRLREAERQVTLGIYLPPAERRLRDLRENLSLHTGVAEYLTKRRGRR